MAKPALGRGLGALLGAASSGSTPTGPSTARVGAAAPNVSPQAAAGEHVQKIPLQRVVPSSLQPRKDFPEETLKELADSIREQGILQPLIVRSRGDQFELIAGERRWRAAHLAGLTEVPVIVRSAEDGPVLEMMLIENLQREDLNPIEEAQGYQRLISEFQLRQEDVAAKVGKNRATVANALRLLALPSEVQDWIRHGLLSAGHAKVILGLTGLEEQKLAAQAVLKDGMSVRSTEELVARWQKDGVAGPPEARSSSATAPSRDAHVAELENQMRERFGTKVQLRYRKGKGSITVHFYNDDDLDRLLDIFSIKVG